MRNDQYKAFDAENQISPRANLLWKLTDDTPFHLGYARYFSPPPYELVAATDIALFDNATAAADHNGWPPASISSIIQLAPLRLPPSSNIGGAMCEISKEKQQ